MEMDTEIKNNPVGRLREVVIQFKDKAVKEAPVGRLWAATFECYETDGKAIFKGIGLMFDLNDEARHAVDRLAPNSPPFFYTPLDKIDQLLSVMSMGTPWGHVLSFLDSATMTALEFLEHTLDHHYAKPVAGTQNKISDLITKLDELISACLASDLETELKNLLIRQLNSLRGALLEFRLSGPAGLEAALEQAAGSVLRHQEAIKAELTTGNPIMKQFFDLLGKANDIASGYQMAAPALTSVGLTLLNLLK